MNSSNRINVRVAPATREALRERARKEYPDSYKPPIGAIIDALVEEAKEVGSLRGRVAELEQQVLRLEQALALNRATNLRDWSE